MNRTRAALLVSSILVALLVAPAAGAKTTAALPDLVVKKVSKPPKTKTVGTKLRLVVKVGNVGDAKAGKSKLGLYLGKGKKHTKKDKRLKRVKVKPLAAGKAKKVKARFVLPKKAKLGSYRIFVCADDTKKLKEEKERNCKATRKIRLLAKQISTPAPPPALSFTMSDGFDWGYNIDANRDGLEPGKPVTLNLTAANGVAGQAGYTRSSVAAEGFRSGNTTTLDFSDPLENNEDDGQVTRQLPFAFPFGGVREQTVSVSTNGRIAFGEPAWDYGNDTQPTDYRGIPFVVGELVRGILPYWTDLAIDDVGTGAGSVREVVAPDNSWVAFQWDAHQVPGDTPHRTLQLVLFPDGSFRFDYPGENTAGGNRTIIGYSLGTGPGSADIVDDDATGVPSSSLLFTPNALPATGPGAPGEVTAVLPKGSSFVSAGAGCSLTTAPGAFNTGLVTCPMPALDPGAQASQAVTFAAPEEAPAEHGIANFRLLGTYVGNGLTLTDGDEIDSLTTNLRPSTINVSPNHTGGNIEAGVPTTFEVTFESTAAGLDEPTASFEITNATFSNIEIDNQAIECTGLGGSSATCALPSGTDGTVVELTAVPVKVDQIILKSRASALNAPEATASLGLIP